MLKKCFFLHAGVRMEGGWFGGRERECQKQSFVKTSLWRMHFAVLKDRFLKLVHLLKQESASFMKNQV